MPSAVDERRRGRSGMKKLGITCICLASGLAIVGVVCVALIAGFITHGPMMIGGLGTRIAAALNDRFGHGSAFAVGPTSLVARGFGPTLSMDGLTISGPDREKILFAPRAEISLDTMALITGKIVPKRLEVFDLELRLVLLKDGSLALAAGRDAKPFFQLSRSGPPETPAPASPESGPAASVEAADAVAPHRAVVMKQAAKSIRVLFDAITSPTSPLAAVDRLGVQRGRLVIEDQTTNEEVVYKNLDLEFNKSASGTMLTMAAEGPSQRWTIAARASGIPGAARTFKVDIKNLSQDELQLLAGTRSLGFETDMPLSLSFSVGLNPNDTMSEAVATFKSGPGFFRLDDPDHEPLLVDSLSGEARWNGATRQIEVKDAEYKGSGGTHIVVGGSILPPLNEGQPWTVGLATTAPGVLGPDYAGEAPVAVDKGQLSARLFLADKKMVIDRFAIGTGSEGGIAAAGEVDWVHGPHVRLGASIAPTTVRVAKRVWPAFVAAPVRSWILSHFEGGVLDSGTMRIDYDADALLRMRSDRAPPDDSVALDFSVKQARIAFLPGVPPIENATATGHVTGRSSHFTVANGTINADGRTIALSDGVFSVADADIHPTPAKISARVTGSVEAISDILSRDSLREYASLPLDPTTLKGQVDGHLEEGLILGAHGGAPPGSLRINATVTNFSADHLIGKEKLENATVAIVVDPKGLKATGQGRIFGGPATFDINRTGSQPAAALVNVTLDDAARARLGMPALPGVSGPIAARIATTLAATDKDKVKAQVDLDLSRMTLSASLFNLAKPAGKPGKISLGVATGDGKISIDPVVVDIGSLQARGSVDLGGDSSFRSAHFSSVKVSPGDDMKVDVSKADDALKLSIRGSTIDARPFLHALTQTPPETAASVRAAVKADRKDGEAGLKGFDVDLKSGILTGFNKEIMSGVDLHLSKRGSQIRQFSVQGKFGRATVSGSMAANQRMRVATQNAGALVSFIDLYKHMEGGQLSASMLVGDDTLDGSMEIRDFILRDEPAMRKLVAQSLASSQPGDSASTAARSVDGNAVGFNRLKVNFQRAGSRLELRDATMYGQAIGLSVDGWLDYAHDRVGMTGTFVPAFAVNNLFSQVPVLGFFLGGASNEGLFAINFKISGLASSPTLSVNPLSAIAPGFLRKVFGALDAGNAGASSEIGGSPAR